ncbi:hypothetical protein CR205_12760 [Alteribacter lacisalsi]|uniref:ATP-grasp domain-containing protein n=1 Tax=Alteribacter lacisalsi TaxID=2045244 RepID=A0A2W0H636_9BACI|nr:YheC/YheD family protein [Alteribacter lacisalsi]PYZ96577.1 hypothetical protein CR205_12760 [Alteribacter lacisalsi]
MIGVIIGKKEFKRIQSGTAKNEYLPAYVAFVNAYMTPVMFFVLNSGAVGEGKTRAVVFEPGGRRSEGILPLPNRVYCRSILSPGQRELAQQIQDKGITTVYQLQSKRERDKLRHMNILRKDRSGLFQVPETKALSWQQLQNMLRKHKKVIVKLRNGALGRRVYSISKTGTKYLLTSSRKGEMNKNVYTAAGLRRFFRQRKMQRKRWVVQQYVAAKKQAGRTLECRFSVQKGETGEWMVAAKAIRLSRKGHFLTNVAQGATAVPFSEAALQAAAPGMEKKLNRASIQIARRLEKSLPVIDLGLDLMIDPDDRIWLIEANQKDQRLTYRYAGMEAEYRETFMNPLRYLLSRRH